MAYPLRAWCNIIEDLRNCFKSRNFSYMGGLLEELQYAGTKMEAALEGKNNIQDWAERRSNLNREIENLEAQIKEKKNEIEKLTGFLAKCEGIKDILQKANFRSWEKELVGKYFGDVSMNTGQAVITKSRDSDKVLKFGKSFVDFIIRSTEQENDTESDDDFESSKEEKAPIDDEKGLSL